MHFKSRLLFIVVDGTYQKGEINVGNQFTGNFQSPAAVTRVEDATLRVWGADILSATFGKHARRFVMAMAPADSLQNPSPRG